jgi:hypothetical protein
MNRRRQLVYSSAPWAIALAVGIFAARTSSADTELPDPTIVANAPAFNTFDVSYFLDDNFAFDYASAGQGTNTFVDFDFGVATLISQIVYTDRTTAGGANGSGIVGAGASSDNVTGYDLIFDDASDFATPLFTQGVSSPGFSNTDPAVSINGGLGIMARFVRFDVTASNGSNVGGSEIQFFTVPEPPSLALGAFCSFILGLWIRMSRARSVRMND